MSLCKHVGIFDSLLSISQGLDHIEWKIERAISEGKIDQSFIANVTEEKLTCGLFFKIIPDNTPIAPGDDQYIKDKLFRLDQKITALVPIKTIVPHEHFSEKIFQTADKKDQSAPSLPTLSHNIGSLRELEPGELSSSSGATFEALLAYDEKVIHEMIEFLSKNDSLNFKKAMSALPVQTQNKIYRKHWEIMGSPTKTSMDSYLRSIAHSDFGRVSLLGLESRCDVSSAKKIQTLQAFMGKK